jgi:cytochrome c oxidase cbb3-type subunit 3
MKKWISVLILFFVQVTLMFSEGPAPDITATTDETPTSFFVLKGFTFQDFLVVGVVISILILSLVVVRMLIVLNLQVKRLAKARETNDPHAVLDGPDWFETFTRKFYGLKPLSMEKDLIMEEHEYDGIVELKNGMPPWLQAFFVVTIIFAVSYWTYYMVLDAGPDQYEEYQIQLEKANIEKEKRNKLYANSIDENNVELTNSAADLDKGKLIFTDNCATCHKVSAGGDSGPNLTDEYWIHGGGIKNIFKTIKYGFIEKGMPSWSDKLNPLQVKQVASFVISLQGSNPPDGKSPQGEIWKDVPVSGDSLSVSKDSLLVNKKDSLK